MKKVVLTLAMVAAMGFGSYAQGRLFGNDDARLGNREEEDWGMSTPARNGESGDAPLGSGALLMVGFGAAYLAMRKRNEKE